MESMDIFPIDIPLYSILFVEELYQNTRILLEIAAKAVAESFEEELAPSQLGVMRQKPRLSTFDSRLKFVSSLPKGCSIAKGSGTNIQKHRISLPKTNMSHDQNLRHPSK